jgi:isopentenyl diphosphate isomerase/L-lactate dehydrogenase-like FMN-dependent dehydrogenase
LRKHTDLPIGLKGVQSLEDAKRAMEEGVDAIYLSNHGWASFYTRKGGADDLEGEPLIRPLRHFIPF